MANWFLTKMQRQFNGERIVFSTDDVGRIAWSDLKRKISWCKPHPLYKNKLRIDGRYKCKTYNYKNFRRQHKKKICVEFGFGNEFIYVTPEAQTTKKKIDKLDLILKSFLVSRHLWEWKDVLQIENVWKLRILYFIIQIKMHERHFTKRI